MTNAIAFWVFALIAAALATDWYVFDAGGLIFVARRGMDLIEWLAFGR